VQALTLIPQPVLGRDRIRAWQRLGSDSIRVLLVDDDVFQLDFVSEVLMSLDLREVTAMVSGARALQLLSQRQQPFDVLLMDLAMPGADGFPFLEAVAQTGFRGATIFMSGHSEVVLRSAKLVAQLRRLTLLGTVAKPVGRTALGELIDRLG
jgi:CheY-like chemotaxis protein